MSAASYIRAAVAAAAFMLALGVPATAQATFPGANGKIAYASDAGGNSEIYSINADGTGLTDLTHSPADDEDPAWSPDGSKIVFDSGPGPSAEIYVMNADGTGALQLTHDHAFDVFPSFSPDGKKIVYTSTVTGDAEVWSMNADGTGQTRLTHTLGEDDTPEYAPDGSKIAFSSNRDGNFEIYVMDANGSDQTNLTKSPGQDQAPSWAPSDNAILFTSERDGNSEVYAMLPDGSNPEDVTRSSSQDLLGMLSPDGLAFTYASDETDLAGRTVQTVKAQCVHLVAYVPPRVEKGIFLEDSRRLNFYFTDPAAQLSAETDLTRQGWTILTIEVVPIDQCKDAHLEGRAVEGSSRPSVSGLSWQPLHAGDLVAGVRGPARAKKGKAIRYRLRAWNTHTGLAEEGVQLAVKLPAGVVVSSLDPACVRAGRSIVCDTGALAPWDVREVGFRLISRRARTLSLSAKVSGSLPELDPSSNIASSTTKVS